MATEQGVLRLGLVGCGLMGGHYHDVFSRMDTARITACCDPTPDKLASFADRRGIPNRHTDYLRMIQEEDLDAVLNVTPDSLHVPVIQSALDRELPVLTEKPLGLNWSECASLADWTAERFEDHMPAVVVNFSKRNTSAVHGARQLVESGVLGDLVSIDASYLQGWVYTQDWGNWRENHAWLWRLDAAYSSLGVFSDLGSHLVDLVLVVTRRRALSACCHRSFTVDKGTETWHGHRLDSPDLFEAGLILDGQVSASLRTSRIHSGETDRLQVRFSGTQGSLDFDLAEHRHHLRVFLLEDTALPSGFEGPERIPAKEWTVLTPPRPVSIYQQFLQVVEDGTGNPPSLGDAMEVQRLLEATGRSAAHNGRVVSLAEIGR